MLKLMLIVFSLLVIALLAFSLKSIMYRKQAYPKGSCSSFAKEIDGDSLCACSEAESCEKKN